MVARQCLTSEKLAVEEAMRFWQGSDCTVYSSYHQETRLNNIYPSEARDLAVEESVRK